MLNTNPIIRRQARFYVCESIDINQTQNQVFINTTTTWMTFQVHFASAFGFRWIHMIYLPTKNEQLLQWQELARKYGSIRILTRTMVSSLQEVRVRAQTIGHDKRITLFSITAAAMIFHRYPVRWRLHLFLQRLSFDLFIFTLVYVIQWHFSVRRSWHRRPFWLIAQAIKRVSWSVVANKWGPYFRRCHFQNTGKDDVLFDYNYSSWTLSTTLNEKKDISI